MLNLEKIRVQMGQLGLNQAELAAHCGVSKEAVSNWLSGESIPRPRKLAVIAAVLEMSVEALFDTSEVPATPVVAYRTRKNVAPSAEVLEAALEIGNHLRELLAFVRPEDLFAAPLLSSPVLSESYIRAVARQTRLRINLTDIEPVTCDDLLSLHHSFQSILVPVVWGAERVGHENALSVYLPDTKSSWVMFSLNARIDDFNYWLAHELAHTFSLHALQNEEGELFAEKFAQELLFPHEAAEAALDAVINSDSPMAEAERYAKAYNISVVTVIRQLDRVALSAGRPCTGLETRDFWDKWNASRGDIPTVTHSLFGIEKLSVQEYVEKCEEKFKTPIFKALGAWQRIEGGRSPSFVAATLNIGLTDAIELSHFLSQRSLQFGAGGRSEKSS